MFKLIRNAYLTGIYLLLYIPIGVLILYSFNSAKFGAEWKGFSLDWYISLLDNMTLRDAAMNSISVSLAAATLSTLIATISAVSLYRYQFKGKQALNGLLFIVMMSPDIVMAISLLILFIAVDLELGFWSLLLAHITFCLPF
ncbi:MAG TPA: spermidine/putrescine ABC transporter permease PotC, partial [Pseudomonadales bacterium]|nr:spermidine/putrescine ABC transporter permease PotC [Pseudomonadales bacterium]